MISIRKVTTINWAEFVHPYRIWNTKYFIGFTNQWNEDKLLISHQILGEGTKWNWNKTGWIIFGEMFTNERMALCISNESMWNVKKLEKLWRREGSLIHAVLKSVQTGGHLLNYVKIFNAVSASFTAFEVYHFLNNKHCLIIIIFACKHATTVSV